MALNSMQQALISAGLIDGEKLKQKEWAVRELENKRRIMREGERRRVVRDMEALKQEIRQDCGAEK